MNDCGVVVYPVTTVCKHVAACVLLYGCLSVHFLQAHKLLTLLYYYYFCLKAHNLRIVICATIDVQFQVLNGFFSNSLELKTPGSLFAALNYLVTGALCSDSRQTSGEHSCIPLVFPPENKHDVWARGQCVSAQIFPVYRCASLIGRGIASIILLLFLVLKITNYVHVRNVYVQVQVCREVTRELCMHK
jgi:hypothetical protein